MKGDGGDGDGDGEMEWMWKWLNKFLVESVKMNEKSEIPVSKV